MSQKVDINDVVAVQTTLKMLKPGMYVFHYVKMAENAPPIPLVLSLAPVKSEGTVEFLCPEGVERQTLAEPGDYIVVSVRQGPVVIAVNKYLPFALKDKVAARVRIESLDELFKEKSAEMQAEPSHAAVSEQVPTLSLSGHVERRGDVAVPMGRWLGDPDSQSRIEGVYIDWPNRPQGVDIVCACVVAGRELRGTSGQFIGTRGKAAPIQKIGLRLAGEKVSHYQLEGEAAFSDGSRRPLGDGKLASAANSGAYLVALRLRLTILQVQHSLGKKKDRGDPKTKSAWTDPSVTRIVNTLADS